MTMTPFARIASTAVVILAAQAGRVQAEDAAALLARAPAITLDEALVPLTAPVEIAQAGWGPFRRLCVAQTLLRPSDGGEVAAAPPTCFGVEEATEENGTWRLSLRAELGGGAPEIRVGVTRDATGHFGPVTVSLPEGLPPLPAQQVGRLQAVLQAALQAHSMERTTIAPGTAFVIPLPIGGLGSNMHVAGGGFACTPDGQGAIGRRPVIIAACNTTLSAEVSPGRAMHITAAGRFAIDIQTGMILRHGYGSFLVMDADPSGSMGPTEMRGVSRQSLE